MDQIKVGYHRILNFKVVIATTLASVLFINAFIYFSPLNSGWWHSSQFSVVNLLRFLFIDQTLVELVTVFILVLLIKVYAEQLLPEKLVLNKRSILKYELLFLPISFLAFFVFNPFTQTLRFLIDYFPHWNWAIYFDEYFYSIELYLIYLPISLQQTYIIVNYNLFKAISQSKLLLSTAREFSSVEANTPTGKRMIPISDIIYCKRLNRKSWLFTANDSYKVLKSISELEQILGTEFIRINRSTIVKMADIESYAFWENDKYVVKMNNGLDFTMSRERLNKIKSKLRG